MREETIGSWFDEATFKGYEQGFQEGFLEGFQQGFQEGFQQGFQEGFQEGVQEGLDTLAKLLELQVQQRFGGMPGWVSARLQGAKKEELLGWAVRILTAQSVQELFNGQALATDPNQRPTPTDSGLIISTNTKPGF